MIAILKQDTSIEEQQKLMDWFISQGLKVEVSVFKYQTILGVIGDISSIDMNMVELFDVVDSIKLISEPYKRANRKFHREDTVIKVGDAIFGGGNFSVIAGPCSVESKEQLISVAHSVKEAGAKVLRGGAFKPRTSPYSFQGMKDEGLRLLLEAKRQTGLPIVTEIMDKEHLPMFEDVDIIQVGARNMQNFELLTALGKVDKPILLKRGIANTVTEFLMAAEYIMAGGNEKIILCERGIRTFEDYTRNTLDLSIVPVIHKLSHLPIIVDPSHATGMSDLVKAMSMGATAVGADGIMIEVHNQPKEALCDGAQSVTPDEFFEIMRGVKTIRKSMEDSKLL